MWLEKLNNFHKKQLMNREFSYLNSKFDLHKAVYAVEVLSNQVNFKVTKDNLLKISMNNKSIDADQFYFLWQTIRS